VSEQAPIIVVLAGPNGAGKSTTAPALLQGTLGVTEFVNADDIAADMAAGHNQAAAMAAGRIMLARIKALARQRANFAFETTLASRSFAPWLGDLKKRGFIVHLMFLWLPLPELAIKRVSERVAQGGHDVPTETVLRRYRAGLHNFFSLYEPLASTWRFYDASGENPKVIAARLDLSPVEVYDEVGWNLAQKRSDS
jgi:predicted ABC-type ATPase